MTKVMKSGDFVLFNSGDSAAKGGFGSPEVSKRGSQMGCQSGVSIWPLGLHARARVYTGTCTYSLWGDPKPQNGEITKPQISGYPQNGPFWDPI